jgi:hypothetical protein
MTPPAGSPLTISLSPEALVTLASIMARTGETPSATLSRLLLEIVVVPSAGDEESPDAEPKISVSPYDGPNAPLLLNLGDDHELLIGRSELLAVVSALAEHLTPEEKLALKKGTPAP